MMCSQTSAKKWQQFRDFIFGPAVAPLKHWAVADEIGIPFLGKVFSCAFVAQVPSISQTVVELNTQEKTACLSVSLNDLLPYDVIADGAEFREQRIVDNEGITRHRQMTGERLPRLNGFELCAKQIVDTLEHAQKFGSQRVKESSELVSLFLLFSTFVRLRLLPRHPDGNEDCPYGAYRLQPARPVIASQAVVAASHKCDNRQQYGGKQNKSGRACDLAEFSFHHVIVA
jgi:hypothetical protein